jgi:hypothetical protein
MLGCLGMRRVASPPLVLRHLAPLGERLDILGGRIRAGHGSLPIGREENAPRRGGVPSQLSALQKRWMRVQASSSFSLDVA